MAAGQDYLETDVRGLILVLWRRRALILSMMVAGISIAAIVLLLVRPQYTARALLMVGTPVIESVQSLESPVARGRFDSSLVLGEVEVLRSRSMARNVIERLALGRDSEFNPSGMPVNISEANDRGAADVVTNFLKHISARPVPGSYAIQLEASSGAPGKAASIANAIADSYVEQSLEQSFRQSQKLEDWLDKRLKDLRGELRARELAIGQYKTENHILQGMTTLVSAASVSEMNSQLVAAKAQQAEAQARLDQMSDLLRTPEKMNSADAVIKSDVIQKLKLQQAAKEAELSQLSNRYGPRHPEILKLKSELGEIKNSIRGEIATIARSVENELSVANGRVAELEAALTETGGQKMMDDERMVGLRALEQEAEATRITIDNFLAKYKQGDGAEELQQPSAKVISYATAPRGASYPNRPLTLSLACIAGLFTGVMLALLFEKLDNAFRSQSQLEAAIGLPCFGMIPSAGKLRPPQLGRYALARPTSPLAESVRALRMLLNLRAQGKKPKVITFTSSFPGEGKTTLSLWMARLAAVSGERVILVDADLRRPNVHKSAGQKGESTLAEYLNGERELKQLIHRDADSPAHIIFARSVPHAALDLVGSEKMKELIETLRGLYDLVIIDSPACLAVSDARVLATLSDCVLYAVKWDKTPREAVANGVKHFADIGYGPLALVLTNVDVKRHAAYGYGDTAHYYGRYAERYAAE